MRARADPQIVTEGPIVDVVARALAGTRESGHLVALESRCIQSLESARFDRAECVFVRQGWRMQCEFGARLDRHGDAGDRI